MAQSSVTTKAMAQVVAWVGQAAIVWRRLQGSAPAPALGGAPYIPEARPQGSIPTLKMPSAQGWAVDQLPQAAPGLKVNALARGLKHPRWLLPLPNGDVAVSEALSVLGKPRTLFGHAIQSTMQRAAAVGVSPNRITLLRDADGDGVAEGRYLLLEDQRQPFGMALLQHAAGQTFYVGNTDGVLAFPYTLGDTRISAPGQRLAEFKPGGHWTRSLLPSPDGRRLYVGVGSMSNIADFGMDVEAGRACICELDLSAQADRAALPGALASPHAPVASRSFATGLRNPVGMAWVPGTGALWTVVNERDGLGDETPPDYLTEVHDGGFYGWPYCYWGSTVDDRVPQDPALVATARVPDYALGGHTASLGLCWLPAGTLPGFGEGMVIGQHGSWNRSTLSGYKVVHVPFANGRPSGPPRDILSGFLAPDESVAYGRPVGVAIAADGALLVADDVGDVVWRVTGA